MVRRPLAWLLTSIALLASAGGALAQSAVLQASAVILSHSNCRITTSTPNTLLFGAIDPTSTSDAPATRTWTFRCNGGDPTVSYSITADTGNNFSGGTRRMTNGGSPASYLRYSLSINPASGVINRNTSANFTITGTVAVADFASALAGNYTDTVSVDIAP